MTAGRLSLIHGNALSLPLAAGSVHLVVTSPPYFALRDYRTDDASLNGQLGSEPTPHHFLAALWAVLDECWRVLRDDGNCWINLGDKFSGAGPQSNGTSSSRYLPSVGNSKHWAQVSPAKNGIRSKSRMLLPHRFALGLIDPEYRQWTEHRAGLTPTVDPPQWICRMDVVQNKLNGLPESVTDRVRASHEYWFHLTKSERYFAAMDEVREEATTKPQRRFTSHDGKTRGNDDRNDGWGGALRGEPERDGNPLGSLPGSVWEWANEPLILPPDLPQHFACVDEATEIMTTRGWLRHDELAEGDSVAGYNLDTGTAEWTTCHAVHRYEHNGPMVAVDKRDLSMRLTLNHLCLAERATWPGEFRGPMRVVDAAALTSRHFIPRSAEWVPYEHKAIGENLAALLGWVAAEGFYPKSRGDRVYLSQSKTANPEHVDTIDRIIAGCPEFVRDAQRRNVYRQINNRYNVKFQADGVVRSVGTFATEAEAADAATAERSRLGLDDVYRTERVLTYRGRDWVNVTWRLPRGLDQEVRRLMPDKLLPWSMLGLPENERRALLDAFVDGDGHRRPDGRIGIFQKLRHNLDVLQAVAVSLGYKTTLRRGSDKWVLYLTTGGRSITLRGTNGTGAPIPREHYEGIVWCPTTGTGTFIARRNGSVFITGNSFASWPIRRIVSAWSPSGVCVACEQPRRPVCEKELTVLATRSDAARGRKTAAAGEGVSKFSGDQKLMGNNAVTITGYACACATPDAPTRPSVVLDPFSGTGTAPIVAAAMGRHGVGVDLSWDYHRIARWRDRDGGLRAKALGVERPERQIDGQATLFDA